MGNSNGLLAADTHTGYMGGSPGLKVKTGIAFFFYCLVSLFFNQNGVFRAINNKFV